ncbi:MAG: hypothetical protein QOF51_384 [Chloroflexota bacterium]|jgi:steroid delta-isomerase-like uncharacterized protein|nr:hypothetical protein [Chloroflexota bacterium]
MSEDANKATIRHWVEDAWNHGRFESADGMYAPSYVLHDPTAPEGVHGPAGLCEFVTGLRTAMPDLRMEIEDLVAEGDRVAWRFTVYGTQTGPLMGLPPGGKSAVVRGIVLSRFSDGIWAEDWVSWDTLGMLQQLGAVPAAA